MVNSRADSRLDGLEKALAKTKLQSQKTAEKIEALNSQLENFILEWRAYRASPPTTLPTFDGSDAIKWLTRAEHYFLLSKIPPEDRVSVAMVALAGPAVPWIQLLMRRIPTLSWDRFTQEMRKRFGDTIAKNQPNIPPTSNNNYTAIPHSLPTVTATLLSSSPPTTALHPTPALEATHIKVELIGQRKEDVKTLAPDSQQTHSPPLLADLVLEPALLLHSNPPQQRQPQPQPVHSSPPPQPKPPTTLPTPAMMTAPLLSASPDNLQIQTPFSSLLRCSVSAAHQSTPMEFSFLRSLCSTAGTPFSYMVVLRFIHIVGHLLWFNALATIRKHEFEPPPDKVIGFSFHLRLEGKAVLRVR